MLSIRLLVSSTCLCVFFIWDAFFISDSKKNLFKENIFIGGSRGSANTCAGEQKDKTKLGNSTRRLTSHSSSEMFADPLNPPPNCVKGVFKCWKLITGKVTFSQRAPRLPAMPSLITFQFEALVISISDMVHKGVFMSSLFDIRHLMVWKCKERFLKIKWKIKEVRATHIWPYLVMGFDQNWKRDQQIKFLALSFPNIFNQWISIKTSLISLGFTLLCFL